MSSWKDSGQRKGEDQDKEPPWKTIRETSHDTLPVVSPPSPFPVFPPQVFHEQGILFGYRHPQSSATACILSLFQMTNETLNIWTHLLPFWYLPVPWTAHLLLDPWGLT